MPASDDKPSQNDMAALELPDSIDMATFEQILEMDDDEEDREFSKSIVYGFFDQADSTFAKMDLSLEDKADDSLKELSELGHFLKGSSATLGLTKVKDSCEKIQNFGLLKDESGTGNITEDKARPMLKETIAQAKKDFAEVKEALKKFFNDQE